MSNAAFHGAEPMVEDINSGIKGYIFKSSNGSQKLVVKLEPAIECVDLA